MGTGARYYRAALGQAQGESLGIQKHTLAMIPILQEQAEMELEIRSKAFAQELEQTKELHLLAQQLEGKEQQQPVFITKTTPAPKALNVNLYIGIAIVLWFLLRKK